MSKEQPSFDEQFIRSLEPVMQPIAQGASFIMETTMQIGESALRGLGAIASMVGLGGLVPVSSSSAGQTSPRGEYPPAAPVPNIPTQPSEPLVSTEISIQRATEVVNGLPESVRNLVSAEQRMAGTYQMQNVGIEAHSTPPTLVAAVAPSQGQNATIGNLG